MATPEERMGEHRIAEQVNVEVTKRRVENVKPIDGMRNLKIVEATMTRIVVSVEFWYTNRASPLFKTISVVIPNPVKVYTKIKEAHPAWTNEQCKQATRLYIRVFVVRELKAQWRKHQPALESIELPDEINMS